MRVLVISDTHDNVFALKHVLGFARAQNMEAIIHCGDWASAHVVRIVLEADIPLYGVMGNADEARAGEIWPLLERANAKQDVLEFELDGRRVAMAHKSYDLTEQIKSGEFDVIFYGHFHMRAVVKKYGETLIVNPGALGKTTKPSFAVYDTKTNSATIIEVPF
ncbi:MAG: YfcE family phosphodiesterase [Candidatus Blackburnbacteria bacterium]|nr:YfcE family phosphodiesterase [Candidatus Blackburnbacteria bacterium]